MKKLLALLLLLPALSFGQVVGPTAPALLNYKGTTLPATCTIGRLFFKTDATAGQNIYSCTATNTWTLGSAATATTANNLAGGSAGQIPFQSGAGATAFDADLTFTGGNTLNTVNLITTGTITPGQTTGIVGTTTNNDAQAGSVGEVLASAVVSSATPVALTTGTAVNITSRELTPGDWDVEAIAGFTGDAATTVSYYLGSLSLVSATLGAVATNRVGIGYAVAAAIFANSDHAVAIPRVRVKVETGTTQIVYLVHNMGFGVGAGYGFGSITARRMR